MSTFSTHVLDTTLGRPAAGMAVALERIDSSGHATVIGTAVTDSDGRARDVLPAGHVLATGDYRLRFETGDYLERTGSEVFYPKVEVDFRVARSGAHYHVPLLLSPFGYSTYRGS